jgi:hypothetical protein
MTMKKFEETFKNISKQVTMTPQERERLRAYLLEYQAMKPVRGVTKAGPARQGERTMSPLSSFFAKPMPIVLVLALLFGGGGTALAAQNALPGDTLYPVKVGITEKIEGAFAVSDEARASFETSLADRRLAEAEALAARGTLSDATAGELAMNVKTETENASSHIAAVNAKDPGAAAVAETRLAAVISTHADILSRVAASSKAESTIEAALAIENHADTSSAHTANTARVMIAANAPLAATVTPTSVSAFGKGISVSVTTGTEATAKSLKKAANSSYREASSTLSQLSASGKISADVAADAAASLSASAGLIGEGDVAFAANDYETAFGKYRAALSATEELTLRLRANASLKVPSVRPRSLPASANVEVHTSSGATSSTIVNPGTILKVTPPASSNVTVHVESGSGSASSESIQGTVNVDVHSEGSLQVGI